MQYVALAAIMIAAAVIGIDSLRQRRRRRAAFDVSRILAAALARPTFGQSAAAPLVGWLEIRVPEIDDEGPSGVWRALDATLDMQNFCPKLASGSEVKVFRLRWGNDYAVCASPDGAQHFTIELWEAELLARMDGTRTVGQLVVDRLEQEGDLDAGLVVGLVAMLREGGLLDPVPIDVPTMLADGLEPASPGRRKLRTFARELKISWDGAEAFTRAAYRRGLRYAFTPLGFASMIAVALAGLVAFFEVWHSHRFVLHLATPPTETLILLSLAFVLTFCHELAHAAVLVHHDRRVLGAGFFIFFGSPAFFVDASDVLMLDRGKRIQQAFAGPFAELFLAGIASLLIAASPGAVYAPLLYRFAFVNYFVILENLVPLLQLDGYWILCDMIEAPDLRPRSLAFIQSDLWHKLRAGEGLTRQELGLTLYGFVGLVFTIFTFWLGIFFWEKLFGGLITSLWQGGPGSQVLLVLLTLFFVGPVIRGLISLIRAAGKRIVGLVSRIRFRVERSWRVEAAELIDALPTFEDLPGDLLSDLAGRVHLRTLPPGHAVFRQGDRPDGFYVVRKGRVAIEDEDPDTGDIHLMKTLERGESFGELGLLTSAPRSATVRSLTDTQLFRIDKGTFDRLLADTIEAPAFAPTLQMFAELRALTVFRHLSNEELGEVIDHGGMVSFPPGEVIIAQGDAGDAFYAIVSGQARVDRDGRELATLGAGDHFGELALLNDAPRNATVVARTPMRAFRLDRESFERLIADRFRRDLPPRGPGREMEH